MARGNSPDHSAGVSVLGGSFSTTYVDFDDSRIWNWDNESTYQWPDAFFALLNHNSTRIVLIRMMHLTPPDVPILMTIPRMIAIPVKMDLVTIWEVTDLQETQGKVRKSVYLAYLLYCSLLG